MSRPRTSLNACGSAASIDTRSSSRPLSISSLPFAAGQQRAVGVEQDVGAAVLQVADHPRQRRHHHRLADAVQHDAGDPGELIDDTGEQLPVHIRRRLQRLEGARTGRAEQVAAVGRLEIEAHRLDFGDRAALGRDVLEIPPWVGEALPRSR